MREQIHVWGEKLARRPAAILVFILLMGLVPRVPMVTGAGHAYDQNLFYLWVTCRDDLHFWRLYRCRTPINHPPIGIVLQDLSFALYRAAGGDQITYGTFAPYPDNDPVAIKAATVANHQILLEGLRDSPAAVGALKFPSVLFEQVLISLLFYAAYQKAGVRWAALAAAALSFNPGWLAVTVWWGQTDSIFGFFLLLSVCLLGLKYPRLAWAAYGLVWLTKFQGIMILPLLLVLSVRRYGLRVTIEGLVIFALVFGIGLLPFLVGSRQAALVPYQGVGKYPYLTVNAYNLWFWLNGGVSLTSDNVPLLGDITYFHVGMALFGITMALLCLRAWLVRDRDDDYLLWAAACWSFFMLPTQIHERYLYPGMIFLALALVRDRRVIGIYVVAALAFSANILDFAERGNQLLDSVASALTFWEPTYWALALTVAYVVLMVIVLKPLVTGIRKRALILMGSRS